MSERLTLYVEVILPIPVKNVFTYRVPHEWNEHIQIGSRVLVPFGKSKIYTALIREIRNHPPEHYQAKYIDYVLDDFPIVHPGQMEFWEWMADYYMCTVGEVMNAALPSNLKLASETKLVLHPDFSRDLDLSDIETEIVETLQLKEMLMIKDLVELLDIPKVQPVVKKLLDKKVLLAVESVNDKFKPKTATYVRIHDDLLNADVMEQLVMEWELKSSKKGALEVLMAVLSKGSFSDGHFVPFPKKELEALGFTDARIRTLERNEVIELFQEEVGRLDENSALSAEKQVNLGVEQSRAKTEIVESMASHRITLLHGVTGSGKTEIYVSLIQEVLEKGQQVLFLVPEIALTTQLVHRLTSFFGRQIGVYHSKFNQNERVEIWNKVRENSDDSYQLVLGARSAIFLPFTNLGLVVIDEEHETSYKQFDPAPRYNARDAAVVLAQHFNAKVLMGSATPSMETYTNALSGKYGLVSLKERFSKIEMPEIQIVDVKKERKKDKNFKLFTARLLDEIRTRLNANEQVILFQNRRGYNPRWECEVCNWTPKCVNCDVSLTYHKLSNRLKCHYCGFLAAPLGSCKSCGSNRLKTIGYGTEKIEDELKVHFPEARIGRMDYDTTRSKTAYQDIIEDFSEGRMDILVGTQMLSKGLDFDNVSLVGIMESDRMLNNPDFRAFEKSFQMMTQVAGRAGRKNKRGLVLIQSGQPEHWVLEKVYQYDYEGFYNHELIERNNFSYPPHFKLIDIHLKHKDEPLLHQASYYFANQMRDWFQHRVLGPEAPVISKINNYFLRVIKLKIEKDLSHGKIRKKIDELRDEFYSHHDHKSVRLYVDVDPL